jgi:hypothetical protein
VRIHPSGVFALSGASCDGPPCQRSFTYTADRNTCTVAVTAKGRAGASANLSLNGRARCPAEQKTWCRDLAQAPRQSIELTVPREPEPVDPHPSDPAG